MAIDINTAYNSSDQIDYLVEVYMQKERHPKQVLENRRDDLESRRKVLSALDSKLTALQSKTELFTDPLTNPFATKKATASDTEKFTVSAGASAELGNHSISVDRLAISDTRVSKQYTDTDTSFTGFISDQTFSIEVGHPIDSDSANRESISVTVTTATFSKTDDEVLLDIASAINTAMSDAIVAETIDSDEVIHVSVVTEESGKSRLVFRSENSGYTYRMDFTDSADSLLTALEVNSASQTSGTAGGWITQIGTGVTDSLLNAKMTIDGLTFYRDANNVTDAISGVTFQLLDTFATTETITVNADVESVKEDVNGFIEVYNESLEYLKEQTKGTNVSEESGLLARDMIYKTMIIDLRDIVRQEVTGAASQSYVRLFNIGIEADDTGKLSIKDMEKFTEALESNSYNIADIFRASDGIATEIESYLEGFVKTGGTIDGSKNNIESQLIYINDRIEFADERLIKKEAQLRDEFARLQTMMATIASQQSFFLSFTSGY